MWSEYEANSLNQITQNAPGKLEGDKKRTTQNKPIKVDSYQKYSTTDSISDNRPRKPKSNQRKVEKLKSNDEEKNPFKYEHPNIIQ